jgi:hypothetical protein
MPIALIIVLALISTVVVILFNKKPSLRKEVILFDGLAVKWNGKINSNKDGPFFTFNYGDIEVCVSNQWSKLEKPTRYSKAVTEGSLDNTKQVNIFVNDPSANFKTLYPAMPSLRIGEKLFWSKFDVQADDIDFARNLVNHKIRRILLRCHHQKPVVRVQANKIEVSFYILPGNENDCDNLIDLLLAIHDKIRDDENIAKRNTL